MTSTFFIFRRRTASVLCAILFFAVLAFGATDAWAFAAVAGVTLVLIAAWALRVVRAPYQIRWSWFYLPLAVVPAAGIVQVAMNRSASLHRTLGDLSWWLVYLVFFVLMVNVLDDVSLRRTVQRRLAYLGGVTALVAIVQRIWSPNAAYGFRRAPEAVIFGPFADGESFAFLMELVFPGALMLAFRDSERKPLLFACCTLMVLAVAVSSSSVGKAVLTIEFAIALVAATYIAARSMSRRTWGPHSLLTFLGALAIAAVVFVGFHADKVVGRLGLAFNVEEARGVFAIDRTGVVQTSWRLFQQAPALGHGLGAFGAVFGPAAPRQDGFHWEHGQMDPVELAVELGAAGVAVQVMILLLIVGRRREMRVVVGVVLPLALVWMHSWMRSPLRTPALVLTALTLLALLPGAGARSSSPGQPTGG